MSAHTPGPWKYGKELTAHAGEWLISLDRGNHRGMCIAETRPGSGDEQANARLISAAPDMYAVLRELAECSQYWSEYDVPLGIHDRIAAALAKAGK